MQNGEYQSWGIRQSPRPLNRSGSQLSAHTSAAPLTSPKMRTDKPDELPSAWLLLPSRVKSAEWVTSGNGAVDHQLEKDKYYSGGRDGHERQPPPLEDWLVSPLTIITRELRPCLHVATSSASDRIHASRA